MTTMPRDVQPAGTCPKCGSMAVTCTYNRFENPTKRIDSWEHRCADCGYRETQAFRSDEPPPDPPPVADVCPWCGRRGGKVLS